jgi:Domain of unknown function (DUF5050)
MTKISIIIIFFVLVSSMFSLPACTRNNECTTDYTIPLSPYVSPVWHPAGNILGFNHFPIHNKYTIKQGSCPPRYQYEYYTDSVGFYIYYIDSGVMRKLTDFPLDNPAWSADGNWIVCNIGGDIYKIPFDGKSLDTASIVRLTNDGFAHYFPSFSPAGDSIFYDCDRDEPVNTISFNVWKMASDGSGQRDIGKAGIGSISNREPWCSSDNQIYHLRANPPGLLQIFVMNAFGDSLRQITGNVDSLFLYSKPRLFNGIIFFENNGIWRMETDGSGQTKIADNSTQGFSISQTGIIAYVDFHTAEAVIDRTLGTIWTMNIDGTNKKQLTSNNYIDR